MDDVVGEALEAIDVAPRRLPGSEIGLQLVGRRGQRLQQLIRRPRCDVVLERAARRRASAAATRGAAALSPQKTASDVGTEFTPQRQIPLAQQRDLLGGLRLQRIRVRRRVPGLDQRGHGLLEPRQVAVEGRGDQRVEREILLVLQHANRVQAARRFAAALHVGGIVFLLRTARPGRRPRPVVAVVQPAALGIQQVRRLVDRQQSLPLGRRIAAVHRLGPVEAGVAARNDSCRGSRRCRHRHRRRSCCSTSSPCSSMVCRYDL